MNQLKGMHHVTAITSSAEKIYQFFTEILGLRLVKKSVNQDDIQTYHLFFADDVGSPGTDMTFFDFPGIPKGEHGTNEISRTSFRVSTDVALDYWQERFDEYKVSHEPIQNILGKKVLRFVDFDEQQYQLISDETDKEKAVQPGVPWKNSPIPYDFSIKGLGPIEITVNDFQKFKSIFEYVYLFQEVDYEGNVHLFETGNGGNGGEVIVIEKQGPLGIQGYGTVHHGAFRVNDKNELNQWIERMSANRIPNSGFVERYYFKSLYTKFYSGILLEIATDGPGFMEDESYETLGEKIALPPFLEKQRTSIENAVRHIDTSKHNKKL